MAYTKYYTTWVDSPSTTTPVVAAALNNMDSGIAAVDTGKVDHTSVVTSMTGLSDGYILKHQVNVATAGTDPEPIHIEGRRSSPSTLVRSFWLNERGSPRGASVESEPALKLFGPEGDTSYTGVLLGLYNDYSRQGHVWSMQTNGIPLVGTGSTTGSNVIVLTSAASVPSGLPAGTVIIRTP